MTSSRPVRPLRCLVFGLGDVGSAVAHQLHGAGFPVVLHDVAAPTTHRRGMAFADAAFDGTAVLEGVTARRHERAADTVEAMGKQDIPVFTGAFDELLAATDWDVLVDARLRKRAAPEDLRRHARLAIGLGPRFVVGSNCHIAIETSWDDLGAVVTEGGTAALRGEPRAIEGRARERLVYAPVAGVITSSRQIGDIVAPGEPVARIGDHVLAAPLAGALRGLTRSGVAVAAGTKVIEIDPRGFAGRWTGLGERPRRIAEGVRRAIAALDT